MKTRIEKNERGNHRLVDEWGRYLITDESWQVCANVQDQLERDRPDCSEAGDVAENILSRYFRR